MTTFVLVPGMNHGGWWYDPLVTALREAGHDAVAVTPTGLEDEPVLSGATNLGTHVDDVLRALDAVTDNDVALVGHSYAGLLITGAADRRPGRVLELLLSLD